MPTNKTSRNKTIYTCTNLFLFKRPWGLVPVFKALHLSTYITIACIHFYIYIHISIVEEISFLGKRCFNTINKIPYICLEIEFEKREILANCH